MLLAYLDEIGETGAFVAHDHPRFSTSPAFGYAGFVIPAENARAFGARFQSSKQTLWRNEVQRAEHPGRWEKKGSEIFRTDTLRRYPEQLRVFGGLVQQMRSLGGRLLYYADEKPLGTPKQTDLDTTQRETAAMREVLNRVARHANRCEKNVLVMIDQINEKTRRQRLPAMYGHILGRASEYPEMRRIVEPPMHIDSVLSANIQFADWIAAGVGRAIDYQLIRESSYGWVTDAKTVSGVRGAFTLESKLHLWNRSVPDLNHSEVFSEARAVHPEPGGQLLGRAASAEVTRRIKAAAERAASR